MTPEERLDVVARDLLRRGLLEQVDFSVAGRRDGEPSHEHIGADAADGTYRVWRTGTKGRRVLVETEDFVAARNVLVRESIGLARERGRRLAAPDADRTTERFATLSGILAAHVGADRPAHLDRREVVVDGRRLVARATEVGSVIVVLDGDEVELPLVDVDSYTRIAMVARWRGQWLAGMRVVDDDHVLAGYRGDPDIARELGLPGDVRDGWYGEFPIAEIVDVDVEQTAYDVPGLLASTPRPRALDQALEAVGRKQGSVDWAPDEGRSAATPRDGRWSIRATRTGFEVGASGRGVFAAYDRFPTATPAIELVARLVARPLRRIEGTTPEQAAAGRRTGAAIVERTTARGQRSGPAELAVGDLLDCIDTESAHHLYALGTSFSSRSQPPSDLGAGRYAFRVARPLPPAVTEGIAEPWFGQRGGGAMVVLDHPIRWYVDQGYLEPVGEPMAQATIDFLDGLDALPPWTGVSFRGLPPGPLPEEGSTIVTTGLTSTSRDPRVATENFAVRGLFAINGRTGRAIEQLSSAPADREVVFRQGSLFKVLKVARYGDLAVVLLDDIAFWGSAVQPPVPTPLSDFARLVTARIDDAQREPVVPVNVPAKFVGPIS